MSKNESSHSRRRRHLASASFIALAGTALALFAGIDAQGASPTPCRHSSFWKNRGSVCEVRELNLAASGKLSVDGKHNGGVRVTGADRKDVHVRAEVHAWADDEKSARAIADAVVVHTDGVIRADGPSSGAWSVSYDITTPRRTDLRLEAYNGGIAIDHVRGRLDFDTHNGGVRLDAVAGDVHGRTRNGGIVVTLTGKRWDGAGLDVETHNGGVMLRIPQDYSARLETGTVNGGLRVDFPVTVQGRISKRILTTLGKGGALVSVTTHNGGVRVTRE